MCQPGSGIPPRGLRENIVSASMVLFSCAAILNALNVGDANSSTMHPNGTSQIVRDDRMNMVQGVIIVKFTGSVAVSKSLSRTNKTSLNQLLREQDVAYIDPAFPLPHTFLGPEGRELQKIHYVHYTSGESPRRVAAQFSKHEDIEYAVPQYIYRIHGAPSTSLSPIEDLLSTIPNDSLFYQMTHLNLIRAPEAWDIVKGDTGGVVIAIVDGGIDWHHKDLYDNIWTNPGEIEGNGVDDDGNGFVDDIHGWNFANGTNDPTGLGNTPVNAAHGTAVAGVASAVTDNRIGIAGASWNAQLLLVNSSCPDVDESICYGTGGIVYAVVMGADIINTSWGSEAEVLPAIEEYSQLLFWDDIMDFVTAYGAIIVSAAGNESANIDKEPTFPAAAPAVLSVGATAKDLDVLASFSNRGVSVDVFAPGSDLEATAPDDTYLSGYGTSFSVPLVSGIAALVKTRFPWLSPVQVSEQVRATAQFIDSDNPENLSGLLGHGRLDAYRAVSDTTVASVRVVGVSYTENDGNYVIEAGDTVSMTVGLTNYLADAGGLTLTLTSDDPNISIMNGEAYLPTLKSGATTEVDFDFILGSLNDEAMLRFTLMVDDGMIQDRDLIRLFANEPLVLTHDTGPLQVSITSNSNIGHTGFAYSSTGEGFVYRGTDLLFEGGLMVGISSTEVSDCIRGVDEGLERDFMILDGTELELSAGQAANEEGTVTLVDDRADLPLGVVIQQRSYADNQPENDDFVIFSYTLSNASNQALSDLYVGLFFDWDLRADAQDYAQYDDSRSMGYVQNNPTNPTVLAATYLLASQEGLVYSAIDNEAQIYGGGGDDDGFTPDEKWTFLSEGTEDQFLYTKDVSTLTATGPFYLPPGESTRVAFAVIAAGSVQDLLSNADNAQRYWDNAILPYDLLKDVSDENYLSQNYTNPFNPVKDGSTTILYSLIKRSDVRLAVFDLLGREVIVLDKGSKENGEHIVHWNGKDRFGKHVSSGIYIYCLEIDSHALSRKLIVLK